MALANDVYDVDYEIEVQSLPFTDVSAGAWYRPYVQAVRDQGMMQGTSATTFSPNSTFNRSEIVATLFRLHHDRRANASDTRNNPFNDVNNNTAWYAPYVTWAHNNGISSGTSATRFGPGDRVERQEIALIIHNYVRNMTSHDSTSTATAQWNAFNDRGQIVSTDAYNAFRWANNNGIVNGRNATTLAPTGTAIRAEAAAMLVRLVDFMGQGNNNNNQQAQYFTVTFNLAGGQGNFPNQQVRDGQRATRPANDPTRNGFTFTGWNHNFNNAIRANTTITAQWQQNQQQPPQLTPAEAEIEFVRLLNQHRARYGLRPVTMHTGLQDVARAHSQDMVNRNFFGHTCPSGLNYNNRVRDNATLNNELIAYLDPNNVWGGGLASMAVGEALTNLMSTVNPTDAARALGVLIDSNAHRNVLMHPNAYFIGVGIVNGRYTVKIVRPQQDTPHFVPGAPPARTHEFNPQ